MPDERSGPGGLEEAADQDRSVAKLMAERFGLVSRESFEFGLDCLRDGIAGRVSPSKLAIAPPALRRQTEYRSTVI